MEVKRGRPLKKDPKRENHLGVRLSDDEIKSLKAFAAEKGMSVSEFLRAYLFGGKDK